MKSYAHKAFFWFLFIIGTTTIVSIGLRNFNYYDLSIEERPFYNRYDELKPSGIESHGYGVVGTAMITIGVIMYSSRKRIKALNQIGKIKYFLEFHIFLCLVGPALVLYHTTFKFGGIVAVSFWSMTAVVLSGVVGRYLYVQIPKGIQGDELSIKELDETDAGLRSQLVEKFGLDEVDLKKIDALAASKNKTTTSLVALISYFIVGDLTLRHNLNKIVKHLHSRDVHPKTIHRIGKIAKERVKLLRRIQFLEQLKHYFHYWHVIHLPFSIIMFVILLIHVGVTVALGYTWIF
jgi:hypothetical protein